ncbi:MAG: TonB-dependent receptor, partial [Halieaceae bacterium]|nr:TonB-dependent receptor [Halieaceae bacterium]
MMLRESFNNADRKKTDNNVDAVVKLRYKGSDSLSYTLALGRKNRAASYQERYLWLPMQSTGGLADGFTYTGNIGLDSEVAHEIELGLDFNGSNFTLSPRLFYRDVKDYIQGTPSSNTSAVMLVRMMNMMNDTNNPDPLEFNNVDASLWGFDMDWAWRLDSNWSFSGLVNYVRGKREDIGDDLYRIAPPNATVGLNYDQSTWSARIESVLYSKQDHVSQTNAERQTAGYGIVNLSASWQATSALQLAAGVENLLDKEYDNHIGGYNRVRNSDIAVGQRLPGYGINGFLRMTYEF